MSEKVIHELRVVETEDGFRIEIKGDKERLREMFKGMFPFGLGHMGPFRHHGPRGFGFPFGRRHGPWWWSEPENPAQESPETKA